MDTSDIGGSSPQIGGPSNVLPTETINGAKVTKKVGFSDKDSLSAAEIQVALSMMWTIYAENPSLIPPDFNKIQSTDVSSSIISLEAQYHKVIMSTLDSWNENINKIAEEAKAAEKSPTHQAKVEHERKIRLGLVDSVKNYADQLKADREDGLLGSLTTALILTGAFIGSVTVVDVSSTLLVGVTPQIDLAVSFTTQAMSPLSDNFAAQLGLIGAWAMGTLISYNTLETIADKQAGVNVDEKTIAEKYGSKVLLMILSPDLERFTNGMLANKTENGKPISNERRDQLSAVLKLVLLSGALAALYTAKTGHITADEFLALVSGKMKPEKGVEKDLVVAIKQQLDNMLPSEKEKILNSLATYMDTHPKFKSLLNVGKTFDSVTENLTLPPDAVKS